MTTAPGWSVISPFIHKLMPFIEDETTTDIMATGGAPVFIEQHGRLLETDVEVSEASLRVAVRNIARILGDEINEERPLLDARLPDGSRVAAVVPPCSVIGTTLAIRKFNNKIFTLAELVRLGSLTSEGLAILQRAVEDRLNILVSGSTGSGKTTLLNALTGVMGPTDRLVIIEDTAEMRVNHRNVVRLEARRGQPGLPPVTMGDLLRTTLRLRPDRILVGEVRSGEAFDLLQSLNTGHDGSLCTIHANSAAQALTRFTTCVLMSGTELPYKAIRGNIGEALNLIIHIERGESRRCIKEILKVNGYDHDTDRFDLTTVFVAKKQADVGKVEAISDNNSRPRI